MTGSGLPDKDRPIPGVRALQAWVRDAHRATGVAMDYQIAQKLHAASDPDEPGYENQRVDDVVDILLLKDRFYPDQPPASLKSACQDIFAFRANEAAQLGRPARNWPPEFRINDFWRFAYPSLAGPLGIELSLEDAVAAVDAWVREIDQVKSPGVVWYGHETIISCSFSARDHHFVQTLAPTPELTCGNAHLPPPIGTE